MTELSRPPPEPQPNGPPPEITIKVNADPLVEIDKVFKDTRVSVLVITTAKAELVLGEHWRRIQQSNDWQAPLLFLIPIFLAIPTTDFTTSFGVNDYVWQILFGITVFMCLLWLAVQVIRRFRGGVMNAKKVVELLSKDGELVTPESSSSPAAPYAASDTAHAQEIPSSDHAAASSATSAAYTENHPSLSRLSLPSVPEQRTQSNDTPERTLTRGAGPHGVRPGDRMPEFSAGTHVRHRNFGVGTVEEVFLDPPRSLLIRFADPVVGTKRLREDLAPLWLRGDEE